MCKECLKSTCGHWKLFNEKRIFFEYDNKTATSDEDRISKLFYTHTYTRTQPRTHSRTQPRTQQSHTVQHSNTRYIHHSIYSEHTRTDADLNMRPHTLKTYLTSVLHLARTYYPNICIFIHSCKCWLHNTNTQVF